MAPRLVLVTGANGFIGNATCKYFAMQGWKTYGLIRRPEGALDLALHEVIPLVGSFTEDLSFLAPVKDAQFDLMISTTQDNSDYASHFNAIIALAKKILSPAKAAGKEPLLLFTSGNHDTGSAGPLHSEGFEWHDENTPVVETARTKVLHQVFDHSDTFYAVILRPPMVYGRGGSAYGLMLYQAATSDTITVYGDEHAVWHGCHVDDIARAYDALATRSPRSKLHGEIFGASNNNFETLGQLIPAISKAYGGHHKIIYKPVQKGRTLQETMAFSQAMGCKKIRYETGWRPKKMGFIEGLEVYKVAFDAALESKDPAVIKIAQALTAEKEFESKVAGEAEINAE